MHIALLELADEMRELLTFKTATLTRIGYRRRGVWDAGVAESGALGPDVPSAGGPAGKTREGRRRAARKPRIWAAGPAGGLGLGSATAGIAAGIFHGLATDMLTIAVALTAPETGWISQAPGPADGLQPIPGAASGQDIAALRANWPAAYLLHCFAPSRSKEIARVSRVHHDPFEPMLSVPEADSAVGEYRKIADEILALLPWSQRYPLAAASAPEPS